MKSNLSPELQQTQDDFIEALSDGIDTARAMVNGLAVEVDALTVYTDTWQDFEDNVMDFAQILPRNANIDWFQEIPTYKDDMDQQREYTARRLAYAHWMLMNVGTQPE